METKNQKSNVLAIIVMILLFGMISFVTNLASPMGDILKNQFSVAKCLHAGRELSVCWQTSSYMW